MKDKNKEEIKDEIFYELEKLVETDPIIEEFKNEEEYIRGIIDQLLYEIEKMKNLFISSINDNKLSEFIDSLGERILLLNNKFNELKQYYEKISKSTMIDDKTKLYNSKYMKQELRKFISSSIRHKHNLSFVILDFDNFKEINDNYGHLAGDYVLAKSAEIIKNSIREEDIACRFAGDEFCLILPYTSTKEAKILMERIKNKISEAEFVFDQNKINNISFCYGISSLIMAPEINYKNINNRIISELMLSLIKSADDLLYFNKKKRKKH